MSPTRVKCPTCKRDVGWDAAPFRPFCSERCRLIDLGAWFTEQRGISGENSTSASESSLEKPAESGDADE
ncbi:MAG TPA: DNA gyrase inhibitor YacG [Steroidobacteraceae bacterium]|jgi:endogenous inhibitor of DNA gyrase (YacG/DUF329 family)|nr:DNA gyrase inhibitor YacG [Steroidobacteraceae bacterium]